MIYEGKNILENGKKMQKKNDLLLKKIKKWPAGKIDNVIHELHENAFEKIDCLDCANCCKTTSPVFSQSDIERISGRLKMRPGNFVEKYLKIDSDNDHVLKGSPCPFLEGDNKCSIYDDRPSACKTYPHTNRKKMFQLLDLTYRNSFICPAVQLIFEDLQTITKT